MAGRNRTAERLVGLVFLTALLFNPPILTLFSIDSSIFGLPVMFLYVFVSWGAVIAMTGLGARRFTRRHTGAPDADATGRRQGFASLAGPGARSGAGPDAGPGDN